MAVTNLGSRGFYDFSNNNFRQTKTRTKNTLYERRENKGEYRDGVMK